MDVIAIGDNISDCYLTTGEVFPGGNAVNVAVAVARAGGRSGYVGVVGDDARGRLLADALTAESVDIRQLAVVPGSTACCQITHVGGERIFGEPRRGVALFRPSGRDLDFAATASIMHTTYCSGLEEDLPELARRGRVSFDFSDHIGDGYADGLLRYVYIAEFSAAHLDAQQSSELARWAGARGPSYVLVTRGSQGALLFDGHEVVSVAAVPSQVLDSLGAGDSFTGRALYGLVQAEPAEVLLAASARAAAQTCTAWGAFGHGAPISICSGSADGAIAAAPVVNSISRSPEE